MRRGRDVWDVGSMPRMDGRTALVTGAGSGIGLHITRTLSAMGAHVVMAARDTAKAEALADEMRSQMPVSLEVMRLDLADLDSVNEFITSFKIGHESLDLLINNAAVMVPPYSRTAQGHELQWGVNHLGHFALTGMLMDVLADTPGSRVVTQTSMAHWGGRIDFEDINSENGYRPWKAYQQSKLANILFARGLDRRLRGLGFRSPISLASHPGVADTPLFRHERRITYWGLKPFMQDAGRAALPALRAATDPQAQGGELYGPSGFMEFKGFPVRVAPRNNGGDDELGAEVWRLSEEMSGVAFQRQLEGLACKDGGCARR